MTKINPYKESIPLHRNGVRESFRLSHYTSISVLFKILRNKQIKFNRIDSVNDLTEKELLSTAENYKRVFISCFSKRVEESIPMWKMYTSKNDGIMLSFIPKKTIYLGIGLIYLLPTLKIQVLRFQQKMFIYQQKKKLEQILKRTR